MIAAITALVVLGASQSSSDPIAGQAAPTSCANTVTRLLIQNPDWAKSPDIPEGQSYRINFETVMTVESGGDTGPTTHKLACVADLTSGRIVSAKVDGIEYVTTPLVYIPPELLRAPRSN